MKTYNEIDIKYYDNDGNIQVRCSAPVTQDALVHYELMQSHYCKLSFKLSKPIYFLLGDFIDTPYGRFELIDLTKAKDNDTIGYSYEILFDAYYRKFKNKILKYRPNTGSQEATFSLTSTISTHVEVIMKSLAYYAKLDKSYLYDPKFEGEGTDYTYVIDASVDANAAKLITYSNTSVLDAIANIAQTFECEWWFEGNILHFGTCENTNAIVDFRLNDNIVSMSSSQSQSTYANRVYAFGAARNLPSGYKNDADADITKDGVVEKRLMLPTSAECSDKNKQLLAENGFELKNGYIQVGGLHEDQYVEGVTTNDDIYPRNLIKTSNVTSYEKDVEDESTPEEGDYIKRTFYRVNSLTIVNDDGEKTGDMAFRKAYILSGKNLHIVFQSGSLNGMDFECEFNPDGVSEILKDDDGNPILKDGKEQINPKSQVFEIVANEDYGRFLPDTTLHPKDGDTFVLYNWDSTKLGDALVSAASNELLTDSIKNLKKSIIDPTTYTCTAEANYSFNQGRGNLHGVGDRVNLYNKGYDDSYRSSRVIGYEFSLDIPFDGAKYYVGEKPSYSRLNAMESKIEELVYNGQSYLNGNGGSGRSIYIIKSYDSITPTDYNVFSAKAVDEQRLNKTKDDTVKGTITWEKVQKFFSGLHVGNSNNENGGSWTPDAEGRSHLITDYLEVRMKAIFEELVINKTYTIGGKEIISPAGGVVAHKVEEVTVTYNNVSQKAYRCYFLAEQEGDAVDNDFAVGDQVRSESFNVRKGTYHKDGNHFYWRLVIGRDEDPVELEGKKYHYIDLSDTDCATASDVPAKGDVLNQCGNRTDVERQNCLIFSAVDTYSPSISLYHGINSYSFANREYVEYGVNKQNNKAFFNVYGDMYVGDRPTKENGYEGSSYIRYDSSTKQLSVKGKISAKSTVDGKELSQYFNKIAELQNQVDGAIETWFYDGVPTLENAPAISWKTDKDKEIHLGDLYYNNKTGKAYRFAKDSNTYKWTIITDTDIAKALSDARMAQETANGKMKVFSVQPTTPYQVGDIWVNATYPSDGSTYKNEVLRCQTNKAAGSQFAIGDWIKASKYTDDTVANAAKKAAEDAQKAAQTAQTDIKNLGNTVTDNKKEFDNYVTDGYLEPSEIAAMAQDSKRLEDDFAAAQKSYNEVKDAEVLKDTKELTDLNTAFATLTSAKTELIKFLSDISKRYNETDTDGKAAIVSAVGMKFTNFQSAYSAFYDKLGLANAYITSKIYGDLKQNITDLAGYKYLKDALGQTTDIDGGLVMTTLLALRDGDGNVQSGINGAIDPNRGKKSIATWWGGQMVDKDYNSGNLTPATSLIRFDGSGYLANGAIWWDVSGKVHADPTSFIISEKNLGAYLIFFEPTWKEGSAGTSVADLVSLKPNAPFSKLGVSGDATFEGAISFHGIKLTYDSTNKAIKIDGNLYTTGGITAYGAGASTTGGGGLIASVISYARILEGSYTDADLTSIPNAYAIKALSSRIDNIATELGGLNLSWNNITGKPSTFAPSAHTHKWTEITDRITKVSQLTNDAGYLTAHQSLASYYTKAEIDAKGYTTNKGTVTSVALTLPTGLACATKTITTSGTFAVTFASGYSIPTTTKQTAWDGAVSAKHTHSNKSVLDGISSTKVSHWNSAYDWYALMTTDEETADGIINKWNEVVSFLANIAQTDTLSGIVDGINKSISDEVTRAKKAEGVNASGISTNKTSITTLQGYFTSGSAKKALQLTNTHKLWGNSFNGTADINGSIIVPDGKYISIGNIKMEYDATNKALKITNTTTNEVANLYTSGGVSAYGVGTSSSSGGGLNGSVKSYSSALKLTSESLSEIASAYSIKALDSRISSLEGGSAMNVSVSGSGNAVTAISKSGTTIIVTKGTTFLTSHQSLASYLTRTDAASLYQPKGNYLTAHQSLDGYVNAITTSGSGNAITSVSKSGKGITFTKGATFLTSHQSLANYYTKSSVDSLLSGKSATSHTHSVKINGVTKTIAASGGTAVDLGTYLTSHQSLANYVTINDSRLSDSRYPKFANNTWYLVGDDAYIGDHDNGGIFCIKSANSDNVSGIALYNRNETAAARLWFDNTNVNLDKQLVMNNKRIWIQGVGTAGGNNNRLTLVAGMPSGLEYTSCRGTILYSNGIAFADPYNGNSNNDSGWIRHLETSANSGTLEIAVGDDASNEQIHFRWYNTTSTSETIRNDITVPRATGTLALTSQIPTTLPANGGNADTVDGYHANGLLTALSNSNNGISITVGGTTKSVSNISVNHASSAGNADTVDGYHESSFLRYRGSYKDGSVTKDGVGVYGWDNNNTNFHETYGDIINIQGHSTWRTRFDIGTSGRIRIVHGINTTTATEVGYLAYLHDNVASATKLATARSIWGNSFNGTADINGSIIVPDGKYISIGNIKMEYDATNKALKITNTTTNEVANLYTSGGVSAYGVGTSSSSGGGLNGSVKSYSSALKLTSESLSEIASAYSIKALDSRISSLEGGSAMNVSVSGSGNAVTAISKSGTTIIVTKGTTFLTSHQSLASYLTRTDAASLYQPKGNYLTAHQSLDGYVNAITTSGSGNAITSVSKSGKGITFTKGATFLTSHQSLANYYTKSSVDSLLSGKSATSHTHSVKINGVTKTIAASGGTAVDLGTYLTSHQSLANYVTINDSRLSDSRYPKFANNTWYLVGDDAYIGDHDNGGIFCIKSANSDNVSGIALYNRNETAAARLWFDNTNVNLDKQLVMNNKRIWIQGVGTAGGNNNRLTLVAGMPSGLEYTSCRGTILYSNGIAFADPYNGNSNNDSGWIRHLETSANSGTLEIAVGDDASNEQIHFRWYNTTSTSETIRNDITVPRATGTLALTSQIPTTLPANGGNADTVDGYHANGLLTALSNSNNGISITVGGTTKSVSNISVNHASSAGNADTVDGYHESSFLRYRGSYKDGSVTKDGVGVYGWDNNNTNFHETYGDIINIQGHSTWRTRFDIGTSGRIRIVHGINTTTATEVGYLAYLHDNVASATKLATARSIWGQSFDGTGNVNGTIYINNSDSKNGAIILNNNVNTHARISAIKDQVVFNTGAAIRFGATNWEYSDWAGLKYDTVANAIYLGIADGTVFNYYSNKRSNGTLKFPGITTITPDSGARIGGSGGDLYLGNANNSNWVKVQDICSHNGSNYWYIYQSGNAHFSNINVVGNANIGGDTTIGGNCLAKGGVTAYQSSDIRLKQDLRKLDYLGIIKAMGGTFGFAWKKDNTRSIGWIAQHVLCNPHLKDIVETDEKGYYKINYWSPKLIATAFGAIEQVGDEVSRLKARVVFLESEVQRLSGDKEDCNKKRLDNKNINSLN